MLRSEKFKLMKRSLESQRNLFTRMFAENDSVTRTIYKIEHKMAERGKPFTNDPTWFSKLSFLVDITSLMNELNLKLQEKGNFICGLYRIIKGFREKAIIV
ncbi:Hypothetical predicted protein [Octopus vulgaris]|uniref:Uncharacterized protein n=1 Tax=Octopus vulgaris TaxID=6645 RepID=A0AA36FJW4_OCTVU|nr:Hypothetical predicted protein [Octopus vulgaris]